MPGRLALATVALAAVLGLAACADDAPDPPGPALPERSFPPAVGERFFGVNGQGLRPLAEDGRAERLDLHLERIAAAGIGFVRANTDWPRLEPRPPTGGERAYELAGLDAFVGALAEHSLAWEPAVMGVPTPRWAVDPTAAKVCGLRAPPGRAADLAALAGAIAARYGRGGSFWRENPQLDAVPVTRYELWNEPNLGSFWCPFPDPPAYAALADAAADAIRAADPLATLILGGLAGFDTTSVTAPGQARMASAEFLRRMLAARPELARKLDVIGVHAYGPTPAAVLETVAYQRRAIRAAGLGAKPMAVNETGWYTSGSGPTRPVSEERRAAYLGAVTDAIVSARASCRIDSFAPHTWITRELNPLSVEDWYGIADPQSAEPYPSAAEYVDRVLLYEGRGEAPPPRERSDLCGR